MPASQVSLVPLIAQLGAAQPTTIVAADRLAIVNKTQVRWRTFYPMTYDIMSHLVFYIFVYTIQKNNCQKNSDPWFHVLVQKNNENATCCFTPLSGLQQCNFVCLLQKP